MTADLDALLATTEPEPATSVSLVPGRPRCSRHPRDKRVRHEDGTVTCNRCGATLDPARMKAGKAAVARSKREERHLAKDHGGVRTGHHGGPDDVQTGLLNVQSKAGTGWWSTRYAAELDKLPRTGGRIPALIVSNGQPGRHVRRFVVVDYRDWRDLYGDLEKEP